MKKSLLKYALATAILVFGGSAAQAVTISSSTALDTATPAILINKGESAAWSVVGNATGTITLQSSRDTARWDVLGTSVTTGLINWSGTVRAEDHSTYYRFRVTTITANMYVTEISDADDLVQEIRNHKNDVVLRIKDNTVGVFANLSGQGLQPSTATTSGNSFGSSAKAYLAGTVPAVEGSVLIATNPVAGYGIGVMVSTAGINLKTWAGIAKIAASTGSVVDVYYDGFVLALTTGAVIPGNPLVTSDDSAGYLEAANMPTQEGTVVGTAMATGTTAGGLTKIRLR